MLVDHKLLGPTSSNALQFDFFYLLFLFFYRYLYWNSLISALINVLIVLRSYPVFFGDWNSMISAPTLINVVILLRSFPTRYWWKMKGGAIHESNPLSTWPCSLKPASKVSLKNLASFYRMAGHLSSQLRQISVVLPWNHCMRAPLNMDPQSLYQKPFFHVTVLACIWVIYLLLNHLVCTFPPPFCNVLSKVKSI